MRRFIKNISLNLVAVLLLTTGGVFYATNEYVSSNSIEGKSEDLYWTAAQLQIEMERLRSELIRLENGQSSVEEVKRRVSIAQSRVLVFKTPSTVHQMLQGIEGFDDIVSMLDAFFGDQQLLAPSPINAADIAEKIVALRPEITDFAVQARIAEIGQRSDRNRDLDQQRKLVSYLILALWCMICAVVLVLMYRYNVAKRDAATRQGLLEKERAAHKATVSAELDRSTFLATLSHEIRSPLQTMQVCVELIEPSIKESSSAFSALQRLKTSMSHLMTQVHDIMDISAIKNMQLRLHPIEVNIESLLREAIDAQTVMSDSKGLKLTFSCEGLPEKVMVDGNRLRQIVGNLVSNAIRYTDEGQVTVTARIFNDDGLCSLEVKVCDTGIGIPEESRSRIFQPFIQGKSRRVGSSGLGLAVVKELVHLFGGSIEVESEEGRGSVFTMQIPISKACACLDAAHTPAVLIVDDDENIKEPFAELLTIAGFDVSKAGSVTEALQALSGKKYAAILLDMQLGNESGYSVAEAARKGGQNKTTPIIAMTAYPEEYSDDRAVWFADKLEKPFDFSRLRSLLKNHVG